VTAVLGDVDFRNLCKAPSVGDTVSLLMLVQTLLPKQLPETPTLTSVRAVFTGHAPVAGGA